MSILSLQTLLFPKSPSLPSFSQFTPISQLSSSSTGFSPMKLKNNQRHRFVTRAAMAESSELAIGEILGDVSIFTAAGESVMIKDLWDQKEGMAVVALLRHFGCPCCWEFASALKDSKPNFDAAGVKLIAVGVGTPNKARILAERLPFPQDCLYCDPDRKAYDVLGLYYGLGRTFFNPASAKVFSRFDSLREAVKNYTIEATPDDRSSVLQQGGMFVFKGKQLLYSRKDEGTGDHAPLNEILDICCTVSVA
ncbi:Thioredoxin-like protein aaed1 protein [Thalictrum thalictroides]|uniref:Thioredoxin-like protein aaed1 protein n=1 Tax=Thalictrum thalictroides TaxID=46969 RepID=A0A7J6VEP2_THATH|nr:Thioredoxin-like protein aaed1 protein [Thalictrum thalictroides]